MLTTYKICNSTIGFSKYELYNELLGGVILLKVTPGFRDHRESLSSMES